MPSTHELPTQFKQALFLAFKALPSDISTYLSIESDTGLITLHDLTDWDDVSIRNDSYGFVESNQLLSLIVATYNKGILSVLTQGN